LTIPGGILDYPAIGAAPPRGEHNHDSRHERPAAVEKPHRRHGSAKDRRPAASNAAVLPVKQSEIRLDSREFGWMP
jgi:hypothetical protein